MKLNIKAGAKLLSSGLLVNILQLLSLPLLARIYDPAAYSTYFALIALSAILSTANAAQLDQLLHSCPKCEVQLFASCGLLIGTLLPIATVLVWIAAQLMESAALSLNIDLLLLFGLHLLFSSALQTLNQLLTRQGQFAFLSISMLCVSTVVIALQIGLASYPEINGLLWGDVTGKGLGLVALLLIPSLKLTRPSIRQSIQLIRQNKIAIYTLTPASLLNSLSSNLPTILFPLSHGPGAGGQFSVANRIANSPAGILSTTFNRLVINQASEERSSSSQLEIELTKSVRIIGGVSAIYWCFWHSFGVDIVTMLLGDQWKIAGEFAAILSVGIAAAIVASSLSGLFIVTRDFKSVLLVSVLEVAIRALPFMPVIFLNCVSDPLHTCAAITIANVALAGVGIYRAYKTVRKRITDAIVDFLPLLACCLIYLLARSAASNATSADLLTLLNTSAFAFFCIAVLYIMRGKR